MTPPNYDPNITAILLVDPYNDFLSEGGKLWPRVTGCQGWSGPTGLSLNGIAAAKWAR